MRGLDRPDPPPSLSDAALEQRREWYRELRSADGKIRDRWRDPAIRDELASMSEGCCAWCGARLEDGWEVDHYLPKHHSPRLAYCWENLLPSCHSCNTIRKRAYAPPSIPKDSLLDPALEPRAPDRAFTAAEVLLEISERLVDPSFDDPAAHLRFEPALHRYVSLTQTGEVTCSQIFNPQNKEIASRWEKIGRLIRGLVERAKDCDDLAELLDSLEALVGQGFYVREYALFWLKTLRHELLDIEEIGALKLPRRPLP